MDITATLVMNVVFLGTVGIGFALFCFHLALGTVLLVLAGVGRLAATAFGQLVKSLSRANSY